MSKLREAKKKYYNSDIQEEIIIMDDYIKELEKMNRKMLDAFIKVLKAYNDTLDSEFNRNIFSADEIECKEAIDIIEKVKGQKIDELIK